MVSPTTVLKSLGLNPKTSLRAAQGWSRYRHDRRLFKSRLNGAWKLGAEFPCLNDWNDEAGVAKGDYFHQDLYFAQEIFRARPGRHLDVGSRVDGFVAHLATFMKVSVIDIRPLTTTGRNIEFIQADVMDIRSHLPTADSVSCLHTLEHFGLGRYGDPIDPLGYEIGWENLSRMVNRGGTLYFSVPVSEDERIEFNAHRLFGYPRLKQMIGRSFEVERLSGVNPEGDLVIDLDPDSADAQRTFGWSYGVLLFTLTKKRS